MTRVSEVKPASIPTFAVVGRPNKGKSSIVATLARDDAVYIDAKAGSTRESHRYPMKVDGETLYELVDTPGLQRARSVLDWLNAHCNDAAARPDAVRAFVEQHEGDPRYRDECQALRPIVDGALFMWSTGPALTVPTTKRRWKSCAGVASPAWR